MGAASCDASPVFDPAEEVFDLVPLAVEGFVVIGRRLAMPQWRDAGVDALLGEGGAEPVAVVAPFVKLRTGLSPSSTLAPGK